MDPSLIFLILWLGIVILFIPCIVVIRYHAHIIVFCIKHFGIPWYPTAVSIAVLIFQHPTQWSSDKFRMSHPDIGSIWIANATYGLHVETAFGNWHPNGIERLIIREAVDWRLHEYIKGRLAVAIQRNLLNTKG